MRVAGSADELLDDREYQRVVASGDVIAIKGIFDELIAPSRLRLVELHATRRGTRMTVHQPIAEASAASNPAVVRHRRLASVGWGQTAERLVAYLEQRSR